jgi:hypothetical protein
MVVFMRPRRSFLFWGLLLIPLGAIPLLVRAGTLDVSGLLDAWKLWPLLLVGIGLVILIGRTRVAIAGTAIIALTLGTLGGVAIAGSGDWLGAITHCGPGGQSQHIERDGTFETTASVTIDLRCGTVHFTAGSDPGWAVDASYREHAPTIDVGGGRMAVRSAETGVNNHDDWTISVPEARLTDLALTANAATSDVDLGGATIGRLSVDANAGDVRIVAGAGGTASADITMNAGRLRLETGSAPLTGRLEVNAGAIDVCVPADVGLRIDATDQLTFSTNLASEGLSRTGTVWTRAATNGAPTIDLAVEGNAASLTLKGEGACR